MNGISRAVNQSSVTEHSIQCLLRVYQKVTPNYMTAHKIPQPPKCGMKTTTFATPPVYHTSALASSMLG
jgi:hypothetical protein